MRSESERTELLSIALTPAERDALIQLADSVGVSPNDLVLSALYESYYDWLGDPPDWPPIVLRIGEAVRLDRRLTDRGGPS